MSAHRLTRQNARRASLLAAVILLQALCAAFFIADVIDDMMIDGRLDGIHMVIEALAAVALVGAVVVVMIELRRLLGRVETMETSLRAAKGEMAEVIEAFFEDWGLTPSERDVALMVLKGVDNDSIASLRGTAPGTVRAQCTKIYAKAGVEGRAQLFSVFMEELLAADPDEMAEKA